MQERRELRTWQEIAEYLRLSIRAVQNYEKNAGLPVHRLSGLTKSRVWAYTDELDVWWKSVSAGGGHAPESPVADWENELSARQGSPDSSKRYWTYWTAVSALYALQYAEALVLEVSYRFDSYGKRAIAIAPIVFGFIFATFVLGLLIDWRRTSSGRSAGLAASVSITFVSAGILHLAVSSALPSYATMQQSREPWSAQAAYLKNVVLYFLPMATIYILVPFHFVVAVRRDLTANHVEDVLSLLTGESRTVAPRGAVYVRPWWLSVGLCVAAFIAVALTQDLFDHLKPNPFKNLFMQLALGRTLLYFVIGLFCLLWYSRTLNEVKRECLETQAAIRKGNDNS